VLDDATFESTFRTYYTGLCGFAFRYVRSAEAAEDLVQDVFGALWAARRDIRVQASLRAYLFAAVRNRALNARKRSKVESDWERDESADDVRELHPQPKQPDELFDRAQLEAQLSAALDSLPERCALVMRLRWREQLSYAEIAETMGISVKGVEKQLERGLKALRSRVEG
jgi:RNA polymerase sigma-70 factor (ECF subfamily)